MKLILAVAAVGFAVDSAVGFAVVFEPVTAAVSLDPAVTAVVDPFPRR